MVHPRAFVQAVRTRLGLLPFIAPLDQGPLNCPRCHAVDLREQPMHVYNCCTGHDLDGSNVDRPIGPAVLRHNYIVQHSSAQGHAGACPWRARKHREPLIAN